MEVAFYSKPVDPNPQLEYETLREEELLICTCKDHPLGRYAKPNQNSPYPRLDPALLTEETLLI